MLNRLFGSFVLASGDQSPTLLDRQTKRGQWLQLKRARFLSLLMESPVLNRVWWAELRSTQIFFGERGPAGVRVQLHLTQPVGNSRSDARATCRLPSHPRCPLTSVTDHRPRDDRMKKGCMGGKRKESRDEGGWAGRTKM